MKIEKNVEFKGWVKRQEIPHYLAEASIAIGPLRSTNVTKNALPIKVLEYMAASLPILSQKDTLPNNILQQGENGYFVNDVEELASKITQILENDENRIKMGEKSHEIVLEYDWEKVVKNITSEYDNTKL